MVVQIRGPNEFEAVCECGAELRLDDENEVMCSTCYRIYRVDVEIVELWAKVES